MLVCEMMSQSLVSWPDCIKASEFPVKSKFIALNAFQNLAIQSVIQSSSQGFSDSEVHTNHLGSYFWLFCFCFCFVDSGTAVHY